MIAHSMIDGLERRVREKITGLADAEARLRDLATSANDIFDDREGHIAAILDDLLKDVRRSFSTVDALTDIELNPRLWDRKTQTATLPKVLTRFLVTSDGSLCVVGFNEVDYKDVPGTSGSAVFAKFDHFMELGHRIAASEYVGDEAAQEFYSEVINVVLSSMERVIAKAALRYDIEMPEGINQTVAESGSLISITVDSALHPADLGPVKRFVQIFSQNRLFLSEQMQNFLQGRFARRQSGKPVTVSRANGLSQFIVSRRLRETLNAVSFTVVNPNVAIEVARKASRQKSLDAFEAFVSARVKPEIRMVLEQKFKKAFRKTLAAQPESVREVEWQKYFTGYAEMMSRLKGDPVAAELAYQDELKKLQLRSKGHDPIDFDLETMEFSPPQDELAQLDVDSVEEFVEVLNNIIESRGDDPINESEYPRNRKQFNALKTRFEFEMQRTADVAARSMGL